MSSSQWSCHDQPYGSRKIAVVVSGWPRLSESFALNELLALQSAGMLAGVFATKCGDSTAQHPALVELEVEVEYLPGGSAHRQAAALAESLAHVHVDGVHGYFAHQPADVACRAAARLGVPFGFSVHAKDPRKVEPAQLTQRSRAAACIVACNPDVADQLRAVGANPILVPHGVDLASFTPATRRAVRPIELLAVGRLVAKKGFGVLIEAVRLLDFDCRLRIVGDGPLRAELIDAAGATGIRGRVEFLGLRTHAELPSLYRSADIVAVPSVIDGTGDRDGLPNVVLEGMSSGLALIGSDVAAIPTAIEYGITGLLVEPGDAKGLAEAITSLAFDAQRRHAMGAAGRVRAETHFGLPACTNRFLSILEAAYG